MFSYRKGDSVFVTILGCDKVIFLELTGLLPEFRSGTEFRLVTDYCVLMTVQ